LLDNYTFLTSSIFKYITLGGSEFIPLRDRIAAARYNNRFRYGDGQNQRFLNFIFNKDPWNSPDAVLLLIRFIDTVAYFAEDNDRVFYCDFKIPNTSYESGYSVSSVKANRNTESSFYPAESCSIPQEVHLSLTGDIKSIVFDISVENITEFNSEGLPRHVLLPNIRVYRLHPLDRRHFNVSVSTMIDNIDNPLLVEWLVYHLALGVEHFYIFDNRKVFPSIYYDSSGNSDPQLQNSIIRPFLDANLITLIYYPYSPAGDFLWNSIQGNTFEVNVFFTMYLLTYNLFDPGYALSVP